MKTNLRKFLLIGVITLQACNYRVDKRGAPEASNVSGKGATAIDFQTVETRVFGPSCVSCHAQYASYASVKFELSAILDQVALGRMPKGGPVLANELQTLLKDWANAGAPETIVAEAPTAPAPAATPDKLEPTYASISLRILGPKCVACHSSQGQARFLDLSSRLSIFSARDRQFSAVDGSMQKLLDFTKPEMSYLLNVIRDPNEPMPPKYSGLAPLSAEEASVIQEWIRLGLP